ncbi:MAG: NAD(P)-dependent dehydrogenase (short-subunit alcohol dehydrogenase family) [Candidatus Azotimanducaceae bacterium]
MAEAVESAELALFLASDKSNFIVGQIIPFSGGWATNT